jgi:ABC-type amino acid transport substrate-binding protein
LSSRSEEEVASRFGVETEWVEQETVLEIIESAEQGEVDAAIAGISITREREEVIDFSRAYYLSGHHPAVRKRRRDQGPGSPGGLLGVHSPTWSRVGPTL